MNHQSAFCLKRIAVNEGDVLGAVRYVKSGTVASYAPAFFDSLKHFHRENCLKALVQNINDIILPSQSNKRVFTVTKTTDSLAKVFLIHLNKRKSSDLVFIKLS